MINAANILKVGGALVAVLAALAPYLPPQYSAYAMAAGAFLSGLGFKAPAEKAVPEPPKAA